jgi:hypothetical protein
MARRTRWRTPWRVACAPRHGQSPPSRPIPAHRATGAGASAQGATCEFAREAGSTAIPEAGPRGCAALPPETESSCSRSTSCLRPSTQTSGLPAASTGLLRLDGGPSFSARMLRRHSCDPARSDPGIAGSSQGHGSHATAHRPSPQSAPGGLLEDPLGCCRLHASPTLEREDT